MNTVATYIYEYCGHVYEYYGHMYQYYSHVYETVVIYIHYV